jgi:hypothetical protein
MNYTHDATKHFMTVVVDDLYIVYDQWFTNTSYFDFVL